MSADMQEFIDTLGRHRSDLIDDVMARTKAFVPQRSEGDEPLRANLELLFDDLVDLLGSNTSSASDERLAAIASRGVVGDFAFADFLRSSHFTIAPAVRNVVEREGADFARLEPILMRLIIAVGDAYSSACRARLRESEDQRLSCEAEADRLRAISHVVMGVAHELNTPLEVISQAAAFAARDGNEDIREACRLIRSNVTRASRMIRRFRGLSVSESADPLQPIDVAGAVADAIALYRTSALDPKLDIHVVDRLDETGGAGQWHGHPMYFTHVLLNLLSNAEHHAYRDVGGPVEIVLARDGDRMSVAVADRGVGIPEGDLDNVLRPSFTTGRGRGRSGLGMAVVHNLVTAGMHGSLHIDSQPGVGTRVVLDLPWCDPCRNH